MTENPQDNPVAAPPARPSDNYADDVEANRQAGRSDLERWGADASFHKAWDERTYHLSRMLPLNKGIVVDFGCGAMALREMLTPDFPYVPVDISPRSPDTVVIDLNDATIPNFPRGDIAFFSGCLEYINDLPRLVAQLAQNYKHVVCSYVVANKASGKIRNRRQAGWVTDFYTSEYIAIFENSGYLPIEMRDFTPHKLFLFTRHGKPRTSQP